MHVICSQFRSNVRYIGDVFVGKYSFVQFHSKERIYIGALFDAASAMQNQTDFLQTILNVIF